jgi:glutamine cyclotransferase
MRSLRLIGLTVVLLALGTPVAEAAPTIPWTLVAERPRDANAYTQGLVAYRGVLLESTGRYGASSIRRVDPRTGRVLAQVDLAPRYFGEGLTVLRGRAVQLTWLERRLFRWNPTTLADKGSQAYRFEGWGLATNGRHLIASDGSATVRWLDPTTLRVVRSVRVRDGRRAVHNLNELEYRGGVLWANVYPSDRIALIDPRTGRVRAWLDLARLRSRIVSGGVLNGIARDPVTGRTIVTGKDWPKMFVIRLAGRIPPA